jgi:hypothetical protein
MKVYVAGPMRGIPDFNFPAFDAAAARLRALGLTVCNPSERDREEHGDDVGKSATGNLDDIAHTGFDLRATLSWDLSWIARNADAIAVLDGWENSSGARAEVALAHALGLIVAPVDAFDADALGVTVEPSRRILSSTPASSAPVNDSGEVRVVSSTGGAKGAKPARHDLIPTGALDLLAQVYGRGSEKYDDHNWRRGYAWSLSYAAMQRHALAFWSGEDIDDELGLPHLASVAWHAFALLTYSTDPRYAAFDDRYSTTSGAR